jgi:hypothetical protein
VINVTVGFTIWYGVTSNSLKLDCSVSQMVSSMPLTYTGPHSTKSAVSHRTEQEWGHDYASDKMEAGQSRSRRVTVKHGAEEIRIDMT